jgi:proteasome assembly chaperone (PAC2) family protein
MHPVVWESRPTLRHPVLVAAFEGWGDAAEAASGAGKFLARQWGAQRFATIDGEEFYDFTVTRPHVRLDDEMNRHIDWPVNSFEWATIPGRDREVIFLHGVEPQLKWRTYTDAAVEVVRAMGVEFAVTLGALLADVPHTRPVRVIGATADPAVAVDLGLRRSRYEGPTGITAVLLQALHTSGVKSASLWASAPYYLPRTPSPKATLALVERAVSLLGVGIDTSELQAAAGAYEQQVNDMVASEEEVADYVRQLEVASESDGDDAEIEIPHADAIAAEIERFLRDQRPD